eukprot:14076264-Heterocapsa_arctica.AAC.1
MSNANESVMREWRPEHDKVCASLGPNDLKFEEALCKQETRFKAQIMEILEHRRFALQLKFERMG